MYTEAALQPCTDPYPKQSPELLKGVKGQAGLWDTLSQRAARQQKREIPQRPQSEGESWCHYKNYASLTDLQWAQKGGSPLSQACAVSRRAWDGLKDKSPSSASFTFFSLRQNCASVCVGWWGAGIQHLGRRGRQIHYLHFVSVETSEFCHVWSFPPAVSALLFHQEWLFLKISPKHAEAPCFKTATALFSSVCVQPLCSLSAEMLRLWSRAASSLQGELRLSGLIVLASATVKSFN